MKAQVTAIEFDFESDGEILPEPEQKEIIDPILKKIYDLKDFNGTDEAIAEALVETITDQTGWCIKSLNYRYILS